MFKSLESGWKRVELDFSTQQLILYLEANF